MNDERLLESLDACRPGSMDLEHAEMAEAARRLAEDPAARHLQQRLERVDATIATAMHDAPLSEGLEARLMAGLAGGVAAPRAKAEPADITIESDVRPTVGWRRTARRWWPAGVGVAIAAALLVAFFLPNGEEYTPLDIAQAALDFADEGRGTGKFLFAADPPGKRPLSAFVVAPPKTTRWRPVTQFIGRKGIAYDLAARGGLRATLYVVPRRSGTAAPKLDGNLRRSPPLAPQMTTGGRAAGAWAENGLLFVLVVDGNAQDYRRFLKSSGAMAMRRSSEDATAGLAVSGA